MTATTYRRAYGSGPSYILDGEPKIKGVTTMLRGLPKNLEKYFTEYTAGFALDNWDRLAGLPPAERFKEMAGATKQRFEAAGAKGTAVHKLSERLAKGEEGIIPDPIPRHVRACPPFLRHHDTETLHTQPPLVTWK